MHIYPDRMKKQPVFFFFFFFLISSISLHIPVASAGAAASSAGSSTAISKSGRISKTIVVNKTGTGDFNTIQAAVDSVPDHNNKWIKIHVASGVYREKVNIKYTKSYIILEGEGAGTTSIEWGDYAFDAAGHNTETSSTFTASAPNFIASRIAFKNTHYEYANLIQAVAAWILGDKSSFYYCAFIGYQDTLGDILGRHYYKKCYITGVADFIFGFAQSIFEECTLATVRTVQKPGFLTAHGRDNPYDSSGFVFKRCNITGPQQTYLGRPWRKYARVVFYQTFMSDIIIPRGWDIWFCKGSEAYITYAESECTGPGSDRSGRVWWVKTLSDDEMKKFTDISFIDDEGWLDAQPDLY